MFLICICFTILNLGQRRISFIFAFRIDSFVYSNPLSSAVFLIFFKVFVVMCMFTCFEKICYLILIFLKFLLFFYFYQLIFFLNHLFVNLSLTDIDFFIPLVTHGFYLPFSSSCLFKVPKQL